MVTENSIISLSATATTSGTAGAILWLQDANEILKIVMTVVSIISGIIGIIIYLKYAKSNDGKIDEDEANKLKEQAQSVAELNKVLMKEIEDLKNRENKGE